MLSILLISFTLEPRGGVHCAAFTDLLVFPLLGKVRAIIAMLKASWYRSAPGYLSTAREDARLSGHNEHEGCENPRLGQTPETPNFKK
eukprot:3506970-Amphidinium_carterae.1